MKNEMLREEMLKEAIHQSVAGKGPTVEFEEIWEESQRFQIQSVGGRKKMNKKKMIVVAVIVASLSVTTLAAEYIRRIDDITYTFKNDKEVLGPWTVVDFVEKESNFKPGKTWCQSEDFYLRLMDFQENGAVSLAVEQGGEIIEFLSGLKWTKGHVIHEGDQTNSEYTIKEIDGKNYMFYEWKNGDYSFREQEPYMYVLEQGKRIETVEAKGKMDDTNIPFENDDVMKGTWITVDFVENIEDFKPRGVQLCPEMFLKELVLEDNGAFMSTTEKCIQSPDVDLAYWTKGAIVDKGNKTVSECVVKEIDGEAYMFYGWKSDDYTTIGLEPGYYVLKKQ
ncbi:MAG: hypothetical protein H9893_02925 [Candidatus Niameybacter stercoravium]|nr:hypothetical protein [Candidatus Niameybacter stercoravium]